MTERASDTIPDAVPAVDLTALANLPYAGKAAAALAEAGFRLPADVPEDYELFRVEVEVTVTRTVSLIVAAEDRTAATITASEFATDSPVVTWDDEETETQCRSIRSVSAEEALRMIRAERLPFEVDE